MGSSRIQVDMLLDGYTNILSVDYSDVVIQQLEAMHGPTFPQLHYGVADCRSMPQFVDNQFEGVLDKGTLDAMLCGDNDEPDAASMMSECSRLLKPGGSYLMITSASPRARLKYIGFDRGMWEDVLVYEVGQQRQLDGPYSVTSSWMDTVISALPKQSYSHFVYVCVKKS